MYELDKEKIGALIAALRRENGMTQKQLAEKLKVSDKTVSKWETANGVPDISMLIPIAEVFGVTVTELLQGQRMQSSEKMAVKDVDMLLKKTLWLSEEQKAVRKREQRKNIVPYSICLLAGILQGFILFLWKGMEGIGVCMPTFVCMAAFFGLYYTFFIKMELPTYYDENKICLYADGFMKIMIPGMYINNWNWPHVVHAGQMGTNLIMIGYPAIRLALVLFLQERMGTGLDLAELCVGMPLFFAALFVPLVWAAKKYDKH